MAIKREDVERELKIGFDVCEEIGEEVLAFVAVKMTKKNNGDVVPTVIVICGDDVSDLQQRKFSHKLWELSEVVKEVYACDHGKGLTEYCEPCGRVNGGG